jgi:glycerate kinase
LLKGCPIVASRTDRAPATAPSWRRAHGAGISQTVLVACAQLGPRLPAGAVASAIAGGLRDGGLPEPDVCPLPPGIDSAADPSSAASPGAAQGAGTVEQEVRALLDALDFDARMRAARAVVIGARRLEEHALAGSVAFEIATRARQGGVPAYAVTGEDALEPFDARILDLQIVLQGHSRRALAAAGLRLASIV